MEQPIDPDKMLNLEKKYTAITKPLTFTFWLIEIFKAVVGSLIVVGMLGWAYQNGMPLIWALLFGGLTLVLALSVVVESGYKRWVAYKSVEGNREIVISKWQEWFSLITGLLFLFGFALIFLLSGYLPFILVVIPMVVLTAWLMIRSFKKTVLQKIVNPIDISPLAISSEEKPEMVIGGTLRVGSWWPFEPVGFNQIRFFPTPQSGVRKNPWAQNSIIGTDKRVYFIFVPAGLSDSTAFNVGSLEFTLGKKQIEDKLEEMLKTMSLQDIYVSNPVNFGINLSDISKLEFKKRKGFDQLSFFDKHNKPLRYVIRAPVDRVSIEEYFRKHGVAIHSA